MKNIFDTFDGAKPRPSGRGLKAPLSIPSTSLGMSFDTAQDSLEGIVSAVERVRGMVSSSNHNPEQTSGFSPRCVEGVDFGSKRVLILVLVAAFVSSGCLVRTYGVVKERPDQEISGNQGYLMGKPASMKERGIKSRETYVIEVELGKHVSPGEGLQEKAAAPQEDISSSVVVGRETSDISIGSELPKQSKTYVVKKGDTLENIAASSEIYGNKKKWYKIYKANKNKIKNPDKIIPGQVLEIPE